MRGASIRRLLPVAVLGTMACGAFAGGRDVRVAFHKCDWIDYEKGITQRGFKSVPHFLYHLAQILKVQAPLAEVYLLRAISPVFRERIMIVTAMANSCLI